MLTTQLIGGPNDGEQRAVQTDIYGEPPVVLRVIGFADDFRYEQGMVEIKTTEELYLWSPDEGIYRHVPPRPAA